MRSRNIKPGFFKNDILAEIEPLGRILFTGLWCMADREGRLENRPKKIKAEVLPYDNCNMTKLLRDLTDNKFIIQYSVDGCNYIQIVNFLKHQSPHINEAASTIPAPDLSDTSMIQKHLIPDSLIPDSRTSTCASEMHESVSKNLKSNGFPQFWTAYPKKKGKGAAEKAFKSAQKQPDFNLIAVIQALEQQKKTDDWLKDNGQFIPFPATWLNQKRWLDEIKIESGGVDQWLKKHSANL